MKRAFFTGLAILLPIAITLFIIKFLVDFFTDPFTGIVEEALNFFAPNVFDPKKHRIILLLVSKILIIVFLAALIILLGFIGKRLIFRAVVKKTQLLMLRIPFVKTIFRVSMDITSMFFEKKEKLFKKTVLAPFPHLKAESIGLVTGKFPKQLLYQERSLEKPDLYSVFVPTAPHPISGFLLLMEENECKEMNVNAENVFKFLVSCGIYDLQNPDKKI